MTSQTTSVVHFSANRSSTSACRYTDTPLPLAPVNNQQQVATAVVATSRIAATKTGTSYSPGALHLHGSLGSRCSPKLHIDRFSRFCTAHGRCSTHTYHSRRQKFCCHRTTCGTVHRLLQDRSPATDSSGNI